MEDTQKEQLNEELKWISTEEMTFTNRVKSKGIYGILVPLGCLVTVGVLGRGVYHMFKRDSKKQQLFMRYRVLAQGITLALATAGVFQHNLKLLK